MSAAAFLVMMATFLPITALWLVRPRLRPILLITASLPAFGIWVSVVTRLEMLQLAGAAITILMALGLALTESHLPREERRLAWISSTLLLGLLAAPPLWTVMAILGRPSDYLDCTSMSACHAEAYPLMVFTLSYWSILVSAIFGSFGELLLILTLLRRRTRWAAS